MKRNFAIIVIAIVGALALSGVNPAFGESITPVDEKSAIVFVYHRIGEDQFPETNIRKEQFDAQIREITGGDYTVLPVPEIVQALREERSLPPRTIGITFDGGHRSILEHAVPILVKNEIPFTVFFSTDKADWNSPAYLDWQDLKKLARNDKVTLGIHPAAYTRLTEETPEAIRAQINSAKARFREVLDENPEYFAYPFGELSLTYRDVVEKNGFAAAFGQQSAVAYPGADFMVLPRFTMTENFADIERFRLTANALPLPVIDIEPADPLLTGADPIMGFTIATALSGQRETIACFTSDPGEPSVEILGKDRIELRIPQPFESSRVRVNCTMPGPQGIDPDGPPRWRWFGMLLTVSSNVAPALMEVEEDDLTPREQAGLQRLPE